MKKILIVCLLAFTAGFSAQAQGLGSLLKSAASSAASKVTGSSSSTASSVLGSVFGNLLGTSTVSESSLEGTWTYSEPALVFESSNVLTNIGGAVASNAAAKKLDKICQKVGLKKGKVVLTLNSDKTCKVTISGKTISGNWSVSGSTLTLSGLANLAKVNMNVAISGSNLQIAMNADKLMSLVGAAGSAAASVSSSLSSISTILNKFDGAQIGLQFSK